MIGRVAEALSRGLLHQACWKTPNMEDIASSVLALPSRALRLRLEALAASTTGRKSELQARLIGLHSQGCRVGRQAGDDGSVALGLGIASLAISLVAIAAALAALCVAAWVLSSWRTPRTAVQLTGAADDNGAGEFATGERSSAHTTWRRCCCCCWHPHSATKQESTQPVAEPSPQPRAQPAAADGTDAESAREGAAGG